MKKHQPTLRRSLAPLAALPLVFAMFAHRVHADINWDGDNPIGNFSYCDNWYGNSCPGWGSGNLVFNYRNNASQTSLYYDLVWNNINDIIWETTFGAGLALNGGGNGVNFNQRVENRSSFAQTVSIPLSGAKSGATQIELNPVNGDLTINAAVYNDNNKPLYSYGNNSKFVTVGVGLTGNETVSYTIAQYSKVKFTAAQSWGDATHGVNVNQGELWIDAGGSLKSGVPVALGLADANTAKVWLSVAGGGTTFSQPITVANSGGTKVIGGLNTGGTHTFTSGITLNGPVNLVADQSGGTVAFSTGVIGGTGSVNVNGGATSAGTVVLSAANTYSGVTTVSAGTLLVNGSLAAASAVTVTNSGKLGGTGYVYGAVTVKGTIAAGASVGTLNTGSQTWAPGGTNEVEMSNATSAPGAGWDFLNITGDLTITATNKDSLGGFSETNKFTIRLVSSGAVSGFANTQTNTWVIATVSGTVNQFIANKFRVDTNAFLQDLNGGAFSVALVDKSVALVFTPASPACTETLPPTYSVTGQGTGNTNVIMTFVNSSGLSSVQALTTNNCILTGLAYDGSGNSTNIGYVVKDARTSLVGLGSPISGVVTGVVLTATKLPEHLAEPATVNAIVMDFCGRGKSFDPVITTLAITSGSQVQQRFEGLIAAEHYLHVINGTPGLKWLEVNLNGRVFRLDPLADAQEVSADLFAAMHEGDNNVVILTGGGAVGASALVMITDTASGNLVSLPEIVTLALSQTTDGLVLAWPDTLVGWELQASTTAGAGWSTVPGSPVPVNGQFTVNVPTKSGTQFYRLAGPAPAALSAAAATPNTSDTGISVSTNPTSQHAQHAYDGILW